MTLVEGERGVIVIDPLLCAETAAAALALYRSHRGERPVTGVLYTHSHADHFGGVRGVIDDENVGGRRPGDRTPRVPGARREGERLRRYGDEPPCRLHVRCRPAEGRARADRRGPRSDHVHGLGRVDPADAGRHPHRAGGDRRRHPDGLPDDPRHRGPGGTEPPLPGPCRAVHGGERDPQPAHAARRPGSRPARLGPLPHRGHQPLPRRLGCRLRVPPLAGMGPRPRPDVPVRATRPVRLPARPDAAHAQRRAW
ncbi:MBL fold metallo-hydrolase [Streptomyces sp. NPDC059861]|uniref:MBL fold metallo-hydrolase n=1 Tax=Streptomyces sp. NPDC059861 TaxID=3346974 RepID=UPI00364FAD7E